MKIKIKYILYAVVLVIALALILTVGNEKQLSVGITSWTLTSISKAFYPIDIVNITSFFNDSNNQLYLIVEFKNGGSSQIGYLSSKLRSF